MSILTVPEIQVTYWTIERLTMFATWCAAFGTVSATVVALWLGYRGGRSKLKVNAEFDERQLKITATNLGHRLATVTKITWRVGREGNKLWVRSPASSVRLEKGSVAMEPGEAAFFYIPLGTQQHPPAWLRWSEEYFLDSDIPVWEQIEGLRLKINTSHGYTNEVAPPKPFLRALREALEQHAPKPKDLP